MVLLLHSGQATAISSIERGNETRLVFQSPPFGASHCNCGFSCCFVVRDFFQSPPFGASHCNARPPGQCAHRKPLSVPSIRGKPLQYNSSGYKGVSKRAFSPLHSGQATAIAIIVDLSFLACDFQSPPFGASHCNDVKIEYRLVEDIFQSPPFGASHCNFKNLSYQIKFIDLSVFSIRGKPLQCQRGHGIIVFA